MAKQADHPIDFPLDNLGREFDRDFVQELLHDLLADRRRGLLGGPLSNISRIACFSSSSS